MPSAARTAGEVDACRGLLRVRQEDRVGREQGLAQRGGRGDVGPLSPARTATEVRTAPRSETRSGADAVAGGELGQLRVGEDEDVAGLAREELLEDAAYRAKGAGERDAFVPGDGGGEALGRARAQDVDGDHRQSGFRMSMSTKS